VAPEAWEALLNSNRENPRLFCYGDLIVRLDGDERGGAVTRPLTMDRLRHELARAADWHVVKYKGHEPAVPPDHVVRDMLATPAPPLPRLTHITAAPVFGPAGTLQTTPGYCPESGSYFSPPSGFSLRPVADHPSAAEINEARQLIVEDVLGDFPFVGAGDRATTVSAMLTPFVQNLIDDSVPLHVFDKPVHRTGTSLAAAVCAIPINGHGRGVLAPADSESEWRKRITAELIASPPTITIDNAVAIDSAALAVALTTPVWRDRVLGRSEIVNIPSRAVWYATGTNIDLSVELVRRSTPARMDARMEEPEQRTGFRHPHLRQWVRERRADVVWALLTLVQVWLVRGRSVGQGTLGGYERWAKVVGGILDLAGIPGLLGNLTVLHQSHDPEEDGTSSSSGGGSSTPTASRWGSGTCGGCSRWRASPQSTSIWGWATNRVDGFDLGSGCRSCATR
jgi:hypothetical protein